ncbi:hypothetical protein A9P82_08005 [Arachidicoccus ginsenosidimutans]|uniref:Gldg family protein n=1 Tax=Arachidicoccus sp. BS20 TaxID=1850526 RepID=UPI0007F14979|nr:Gldg family protein [Arachidicoccus sp. BS20]ANI89238.1 hypothetical protein A9P82_08005 [Arachidicoccus sp. BS20]
MHHEYIYYYDSTFDKNFYKYNPGKSIKEIAERYAKVFKMDIKEFKTPAEIHKEINLRPEGNRYVMQLKYKGRTTFLRLFNDFIVYPSETEVSAALKRLTVQLPKIDFLTGDLERSPQKIGDRDYEVLTSEKPFRYAFINQGFDIDTVSLNSNTNLSSGITALVIADPKTAFTPTAFNELQSYINSGGNLMIMGEPGKQDILNPLLKTLGVQLLDGQLVQQSSEYAPNLVLPYLTQNAAGISKSLQRVFEDSIRVSMSGVAALSYSDTNGFKVSPLLMTDSSRSWLKKGSFALDSAAVTYNPELGDVKERFPTVIALTRNIRGKEQRIIVTGDADMMSNAELSRNNIRTANFQLSTALFGWFTYGQFPIDTTRPKSKDNHLNLSDKGVAVLKIIFLWVLPCILLIFGSILLIRRKRK